MGALYREDTVSGSKFYTVSLFVYLPRHNSEAGKMIMTSHSVVKEPQPC
jgi:hypothetical protein